jgi:hypothetical protein
MHENQRKFVMSGGLDDILNRVWVAVNVAQISSPSPTKYCFSGS